MPTKEEMLTAKVEEMSKLCLQRVEEIFGGDELDLKGAIFVNLFQLRLQSIITDMNNTFGG